MIHVKYFLSALTYCIKNCLIPKLDKKNFKLFLYRFIYVPIFVHVIFYKFALFLKISHSADGYFI